MGKWDGRERRHEPSNRLILEVPKDCNLDEVLRLIAAGLKGGSNNTEVLTAINNLNRKVDTMSSNIDRIEKETADLAEDVTAVRTAVEGLKTLVADLKSQVAQGQIDQARLDAAATSLEKIDDDLDAITAPSSTEG